MDDVDRYGQLCAVQKLRDWKPRKGTLSRRNLQVG
jgi:hypothetical protein